MAKSLGAKPLTKEDVSAFCENLHLKDIAYAELLDEIQAKYLSRSPKVKNWANFKTIEDLKRTMIGLHIDSTELTVNIDESEIAQAEAAVRARLKKIKGER